MPLDRDWYARLFRALDAPPPTVIGDWPEFIVPHTADLPDDFAPPTSFETANARLRRLPKLLRIVCALTAAELALPVWHDALHDEPDAIADNLRDGPAAAIASVWRWLDGDGRRSEMKVAAAKARLASLSVHDVRLHAAATAAESAADAAAWDSPKATSAARCYVIAVAHRVDEAEAYRRWWLRAVCRMAFGPLDRPQNLPTPSTLD